MDLTQYMEQCALEDQASLEEYMASRSTCSTVPSEDESFDLSPPGGSRHGVSRGPLRALQAFTVSTTLIQGCAAPGCWRTGDFSYCLCKAVQYCRREHQLSDRQAHRSLCSKIKKACANLEREERALKREEGDNVFEMYRGIFWSIQSTRDYMRARFMLVEALLKINTAQAVTLALNHLLDMLQLCEADTLGVRDVVPGLYLRVGRDQEAYDFCWNKIREEVDQYSNNRGGSLPIPDTQNADLFRSIRSLLDDHLSLSQVVAITLLKIRLTIDLQAMQLAKQEAGPYVPREILDTIQKYSTSSDITDVSRMLDYEDRISSHIANLKKQVEDLHAAVEETNSYFWSALIEPGDHLRARPSRYTYGDEAQMQLVLQYNYNAWAETPGAISVIEELSKNRSKKVPEKPRSRQTLAFNNHS